MGKVKFKYRLRNYKYKTKTIEIKLPTNEYGFILIDDLTKVLKEWLQNNEQNALLINFEVMQKCA